MAKINPLDTDISYVSKLDDEPNDVGGLSAQELKAVFDKGGNVLKKYINDVVVEAINTMKANEVGFTRSADIPADNVQGAVESVREQMKNATLGQIPDASIGVEKLTQELLDRSYTKEEEDSLLSKKADVSALNLLNDAVNTKASQNALDTTNDVLATKASKEEAQAIGYDGKLYRFMLALDSPWVYLKGVPYARTSGNYSCFELRNNKYIAKFASTVQEFYDRETGELIATSNETLYDDGSGSYPTWDFLNYDDDIFFCRYQYWTYFFNPANGKVYRGAEYYNNYQNLYYLGCYNGYMYYAYQSGSPAITVKAVKLSTMTVDTSKTVAYTLTYSVPQIYHGFNAYAFALSNGSLCFETINLLTGTRKSQTITAVSSDAVLENVLWVDADKSEIYLLARTTAPTNSDLAWNEMYLCRYNYATNTFTVLSKDFWFNGYAGHLDDDTVLLNQYIPNNPVVEYCLTKFKLSTGEVLDSTVGKGENEDQDFTSFLSLGGWCGKPYYHSGRFAVLGNYLVNTETMRFGSCRLKQNAYSADFVFYTSCLTRYGLTFYSDSYFYYTPYEYFELNERTGYTPIFVKEA